MQEQQEPPQKLNVRDLRVNKLLTQRKLATLAQVDVRVVQKAELGAEPIRLLKATAICDVLGVKVTETTIRVSVQDTHI